VILIAGHQRGDTVHSSTPQGETTQPTSVIMKQCSSCCQLLEKFKYSTTQWKKNTQERRCKFCVRLWTSSPQADPKTSNAAYHSSESSSVSPWLLLSQITTSLVEDSDTIPQEEIYQHSLSSLADDEIVITPFKFTSLDVTVILQLSAGFLRSDIDARFKSANGYDDAYMDEYYYKHTTETNYGGIFRFRAIEKVLRDHHCLFCLICGNRAVVIEGFVHREAEPFFPFGQFIMQSDTPVCENLDCRTEVLYQIKKGKTFGDKDRMMHCNSNNQVMGDVTYLPFYFPILKKKVSVYVDYRDLAQLDHQMGFPASWSKKKALDAGFLNVVRGHVTGIKAGDNLTSKYWNVACASVLGSITPYRKCDICKVSDAMGISGGVKYCEGTNGEKGFVIISEGAKLICSSIECKAFAVRQSRKEAKLADDISCYRCGRSDKEKILSKCSNCKRAYYCSRDCQLAHWKSHKAICKELRRSTRR